MRIISVLTTVYRSLPDAYNKIAQICRMKHDAASFVVCQNLIEQTFMNVSSN